MTTIRDIAKACDVSVATVSNILNHKGKAGRETEELVLEKARELKYIPNQAARNLRMRRTRIFGILTEDITSLHVPAIVDGIMEFCEKSDYDVLLSNLRLSWKYGDKYYTNIDIYEKIEKEITAMAARQIDGLIYITAHNRVVRCIPEDLEIPAVMVFGYSQSVEVPSVVINERKGAYDAAMAVIACGYREIGIIAGSKEDIHSRMRMEGYLEAFCEAGLHGCVKNVYCGGWSRRSGYSGAEALCKTGISAVICMSDEIAEGVYDYCHEHSLQPGEDIAVIGYGDRDFASCMYPTLASVKIPFREMGETAGQLLSKMLEGGKKTADVVIREMRPQIIMRESVKNCNQRGLT